MMAWNEVAHGDGLHAIHEYDRLGPARFFSKHGFAPTTTFELVWEERRYPRRPSWARRMSSPPDGDSVPVISKAGRREPSAFSESWDSTPETKAF
jgi:hypothetical protein